jgi:glycosyltransferase involved in cell wall biosynthesis
MENDGSRFLFLTRQPLYPPIGGTPLRNWQNVNLVMHSGSVSAFTVTAGSPHFEPRTPPGVRLWRYHRVQAATSLSAKLHRRTWLLRSKAHPVSEQLYSPTVEKQLNNLLAELKPQVVIFSELWLYRYLRTVKSHGCRIILDAHNIEAPMRREILASQQTYRIIDRLRLAQLENIEREFVRSADQVWVCSESDAGLLTQTYKNFPPVHVVPNGVDPSYYSDVWSPSRGAKKPVDNNPHTLLFTATFSYSPNANAAHYLIDEIYPELKKTYPGVRLLLIGKDPTPHMLRHAERNPNITVTGHVSDIRPYLATQGVFIVPLFQGGGTRLKILEAFAARLPVVSTTKGAEGLKVQARRHLLLGDTTDQLVHEVQRFWSDGALSERIVQSAYDLLQKEYSWESVGVQMQHALDEIQ